MFDEQIEPQTTTTQPTDSAFATLDASGDLSTPTSVDLAGDEVVVPGTVSISDGTNTFTDAAGDGVLTGAPAGTGTVNYRTGAVTIAGGAASQNINADYDTFDKVNQVSSAAWPLTLGVKNDNVGSLSIYIGISEDGNNFEEGKTAVVSQNGFESFGVVASEFMDVRVNRLCRLKGGPVNPT